jgi:hypothetical protein
MPETIKSFVERCLRDNDNVMTTEQIWRAAEQHFPYQLVHFSYIASIVRAYEQANAGSVR